MKKIIFTGILLFLTCLLIAQDEVDLNMVTVRFEINHDLEPPSNLPGYNVLLISKKGLIPPRIHDGQKIILGQYYVMVVQSGYKSILHEMHLTKGMDIFVIRGTLIAKKRSISLEIVDLDTGLLVEPLKVINLTIGEEHYEHYVQSIHGQEEIKKVRVYPIHHKVVFKIKFAKYKTRKVSAIIVPGEGTQVIPVHMVKLKLLDLIGRPPQKVILDGIAYPKKFYVDNKKIEDHLIETLQGNPKNPENARIYHTLWISPNAKILQVYEGYLYGQIKIDFTRQGRVIPRADHISIQTLIGHFKRISKGKDNGDSIVVECIEQIVKSYVSRKRLKACSPHERKQLMDFLESQKHSQNSENHIRLNSIIEKIRRMD